MIVDLSHINEYHLNGQWDETKLKNDFILKKKNDNYLIKYKKKNLCKGNIKILGLFRSVILNNDKIVCISPPKSLLYNEKEVCDIYEFIEGVMVNCWYDKNWNIATKSIIDADCKFHENQKALFCDLFTETCKHCELTYDMLDKELCYSFVFQHPENRIINFIEEPTLYLISAYKNLNNNTFEKITYDKLQNLTLNSKLRVPSKINRQLNVLNKELNTLNTPITNMGVVLTNGIYHSKIRNKAYEIIKKLKMNHTKTIYTYLNLKRNNMERLYLKFFPENLQEFNQHLYDYTNLIDILYNLYYDIKVRKHKSIENMDRLINININNIHTHYVQNLREKNKYITKEYIDNYLINLKPSIIVKLLEFSLPKVE